MASHDAIAFNHPLDALEDFERMSRIDERGQDLLDALKIVNGLLSKPVTATIDDGVIEMTLRVRQARFAEVLRNTEALIAFVETGDGQGIKVAA